MKNKNIDFYKDQPLQQQENFKQFLSIMGSLSGLFSDSDKPLVNYRVHENSFCKYFGAENLSRHDCSADAKKGKIGIGLKTWVGQNNQKVAEFGKVRKKLEGLNDLELVEMVAEFRNERIKTTKNMYGIDHMVYHVLIRETGKMLIKECSFDSIDISSIQLLPHKNGENTCYFSDGNHTYNFNKSKTTLYMLFENLITLDEISVKIIEDPFTLLEELHSSNLIKRASNRKLCLKLYSIRKNGIPFVPEKSGLNQWNASGRKRNPNELYIPFPVLDRKNPENKDFFPDRKTSFDLILPDGKTIKASLCQADGKGIMSNPNSALGKWLLRDVFEVAEKQIIDYDLLQKKDVDAVVFEKINDSLFKINFTNYENYQKSIKKMD